MSESRTLKNGRQGPLHTIAASLCVGSQGDTSLYPQLHGLRSKARNCSLWKCVVVFFATSRRCNPGAQHVLFTNTSRIPRTAGVDVEKRLNALDVKIVRLPFTSIPPKGFCQMFRNAYYKVDAISALSEMATECALLMDVDCLWTRSGETFLRFIESNRLTLYDVYRRDDPAIKVGGLSSLDMGDLYRRIDPDYPVTPTHFGGEFTAGRIECLRALGKQYAEVFGRILVDWPKEPPRFSNGRSIYDSEEYLTSFVLNKFWHDQWEDAADYFKRIWITKEHSNVETRDLQKTVWHMPAEKQQGIPLLFAEVISSASRFHTVPLEEFAAYLGEYVGIPQRKHWNISDREGKTFQRWAYERLRRTVLQWFGRSEPPEDPCRGT